MNPLTKIKSMFMGEKPTEQSAEAKPDNLPEEPVASPVASSDRRMMNRRFKRMRKAYAKRQRQQRSNPNAGNMVRLGGRVYSYDADGVIHRIEPVKPWSNKSERKRYMKAKRLARHFQQQQQEK